MARSQYIARQVATLLKFAKTTRDPNVAAALIEKAADLKAQGVLTDAEFQAQKAKILA